MTAPLDPSSLAKPNSDLAGLDNLAEKIQRERAIDSKVDEIQRSKEDELISAGPVPETFQPDPALVQIGSGLTFYLMKTITNIFQKDLSPLTEYQKASLERVVDKLARKYVPASMTKYQESGEVVLVLGGIVMSNLTDLKPPKAPEKAPQPETEKAPTLPPTPDVKVTVIEAEAPPIPETVP